MRNKFYKVDGHTGLVKNPQSGVILNVNSVDIERARKRKVAKQAKKKSEGLIVDEVNQLRSDMDELKAMIQQLIEK